MKILIEQFSFQQGNDYLDVEVHHTEKWIELKIETSESFPIQNKEELDTIYQKLYEVLDEFEKDKN